MSLNLLYSGIAKKQYITNIFSQEKYKSRSLFIKLFPFFLCQAKTKLEVIWGIYIKELSGSIELEFQCKNVPLSCSVTTCNEFQLWEAPEELQQTVCWCMNHYIYCSGNWSPDINKLFSHSVLTWKRFILNWVFGTQKCGKLTWKGIEICRSTQSTILDNGWQVHSELGW